MEKLLEKITEVIEYNRKLIEQEAIDKGFKNKKKYKNVPTGYQEIYVDFQMW